MRTGLAPIMPKCRDQRSHTNCHPLSDVTSFGRPKHVSQPKRNALEQDSTEILTIGMASSEPVNNSKGSCDHMAEEEDSRY